MNRKRYNRGQREAGLADIVVLLAESKDNCKSLPDCQFNMTSFTYPAIH